jgi:hypothetical protein
VAVLPLPVAVPDEPVSKPLEVGVHATEIGS